MSPATAHQPPFESSKGQRWLAWALFLVLTLLLHSLIFLVHLQWSPGTASPPSVTIQQVNPNQIEAIRKQWRQQKFLLDTDKAKTKDKTPPSPDARYLSDRNQHAQKETRATETVEVPKLGNPRALDKSDQTKKSQPANRKSLTQKLPQLGNLGIPMQLKSDPLPTEESPKGGNLYIPDRTVASGSENLLNSQESTFYSFYERLYEAVVPIWQSRSRETHPRNRILGGEYTTSVDVVLDESGNLVSIRQLQGSGIPEFDESVEKSWRKVQRFPNPPKGLLNQERQVHIGWSFIVRVGEGIQLDYLPPERTY